MTPLRIAGMVIGAQALIIFGLIRVIGNFAAEREQATNAADAVIDAEAFVRRTFERIEGEQ